MQLILDVARIESNKLEQLVRMIAPDRTLLRAWPLQGGISAEMTALEINTPEAQTSTLILRQPGRQALTRNPHAAEDEFKVLQLTKSLGLATQTPYLLGQPGKIFSAPYLLVEYIDGKPEFAFPFEDDFLVQMAKHLAKIHSADSRIGR